MLGFDARKNGLISSGDRSLSDTSERRRTGEDHVPHSPPFGRLLPTTHLMSGSLMRILMTRDSTTMTAPLVTLPSNHLMITYASVLEAYYAARRSHRSAPDVLEWEYDYESRCYSLYTDLTQSRYIPDIRRAFIVRSPVWREIIVPSFRDRVVHHLIARAISSILERQYIYDIYAGRVGRGLHFAVRRAEYFLRSVTRSYQGDAWILRLDIASFFRSIPHDRLLTFLEERVFPYIDDVLIIVLIRHHIIHARDDIKRDHLLWKDFPTSKSLFSAPGGYGLPLGDLVSQYLANAYLGALDHFVKHTLRVRYYGRYMDDMVIMSPLLEVLREWRDQVGIFLHETLGLSLHREKTVIRQSQDGFDWLGRRILPYRTYIGPRLKESFIRRAMYADESHEGLMSVVGMISHHSTERLRDEYLVTREDYFRFFR